MELSLSSLVGLTTPSSMKIRGHISNKAVIVLIHCGASHNFISSPLTREFGVTLRTGEQIWSTGICRQLCLHLPRVDIATDFFPLPLGDTDLILGYEWLLSLGATHMNWKELSMEFSVEGQQVQLRGDSNFSTCYAQNTTS